MVARRAGRGVATSWAWRPLQGDDARRGTLTLASGRVEFIGWWRDDLPIVVDAGDVWRRMSRPVVGVLRLS